MRRAADFLFRNWPLKLGAILLATVLYSGLVLGQNVRTWTGTLAVSAIRPPTGATLLSELAPVTEIRYRASLDVGVVSPTAFTATVDLSDVTAEPGGPAVAVPITVLALHPGVQVVDFQPREVQVQLDPVAERHMPVDVTLGLVPDSIETGVPQIEPGTVTVRGASSRVDAVDAVIARVAIDASALNVDRDVTLVAIDANGNEVPSVEIEPERANIRIAVAQELANRTLPVVPQLIGTPAPGYRITGVVVEPLIVSVSGDASAVAQLQNVPTSPIDISGRTSDLEAEVAVSLPAGATPTGSERVRVMITVAEETGTMSYTSGVTVENEGPGLGYALGVQQVNVTLSGPLSALQAVNGATLVTVADVGRLPVGVHNVRLSIEPPEGLDVVAIDPPEVSIGVSFLATPTAVPIASP